MMRRTFAIRKPFAALLCLALAISLSILSACGGDKEAEKTNTEPPASTIYRPSQLPLDAFALEDYQERADAAAEETSHLELPSMCSNSAYLLSIAGDTWNKVISDESLRGRMQNSERFVYEDQANGVFLVVGRPARGEYSNPLTCYMLVQCVEPYKVLAAWAEE